MQHTTQSTMESTIATEMIISTMKIIFNPWTMGSVGTGVAVGVGSSLGVGVGVTVG